jgi:hypothetical protein
MKAKKLTTKAESRRSIAKRHGITAITLDAWELEGIDPRNDAQLAARAAMKHGNNTPTMQAAKLRKLLADARKAEAAAAMAEGTSISLEEVKDAFSRMGLAVRARLLRSEYDLPPMLEGLTASKMVIRIREYIEQVLTEIHDPTSSVWK